MTEILSCTESIVTYPPISHGGAVLADGITSANTVGYTSKAVTAGKYYLIGTQFDKAGTTDAGSVDMNDLIQLSATLSAGLYGDDFATAPQIQVRNASGVGYTKYFYISDGTDINDDDLGYDTWCDEDGYELTEEAKLELGKGFWFYSPTKSGTITTSGQVSEAASKTLSFTSGKYLIFCNPYPTAVSLQALTTSATAGLYGDDFATAPQIQVQTATAVGYNKYFYISDGTDADDNDLGYNAWCDEDGYELSGSQISAGAAFWIYSPTTSGSITFSL